MILNKKSILAAALFSTVCLFGAPQAGASIFHIDINTSALTSDTADQPFSLDLTLVDGGTFTNTFTISNFVYTGGSATGSTGTVFGFGTATGNLASTVTMTSGGGNGTINDIYQNFTAGTTDIKFDVNTTTVVGGTPDEFTVSILDKTAPSMSSALFTSAADTSSLATITISQPLQTAGYQTIDPSPTGVFATVVPEPSSAAALIGGVGCLFGLRRRRAQAA